MRAVNLKATARKSFASHSNKSIVDDEEGYFKRSTQIELRKTHALLSGETKK